MRCVNMGLFVVFCLMAFAYASPAKGGASTACTKQCDFNFDPICATPQTGSGPKLSFGSECVLEKYNCEHADARYAQISKGECPGSTGIRLQ